MAKLPHALKDQRVTINGEYVIMKYDDLSGFVFEFMNEFFLHEASGLTYFVSDEDVEERMTQCRACEHYDEPENGCKKCGCHLFYKTKDPFAECPIQKWVVDDRQWNKENYQYILNKMRERTGKYE